MGQQWWGGGECGTKEHYLDECHPIEDPNAPSIYDSDKYNDIDYKEIVKTYKVGYERTDSSSSEEDNEKVSNDGGSNDINDGPEAIDDKDAKPKFDYQKWKEDFNMHSDEEEQPLFPVEEEVSLVYPTKIEIRHSWAWLFPLLHQWEDFKKLAWES